MEALSFSETSVLTKPHGVTSQKTPFFISDIGYTFTLKMEAVRPSETAETYRVKGIIAYGTRL
jgi:hypothetical protein